MKVAIDKRTIDKIKDLEEFEYYYVFDEEPLEKLLKLKVHCMHKDNIDDMDINLTDYDMTCLKKANINDKDWRKLPEKIDYKYAIIVPNYNNDHRKLQRQDIFKELYRQHIESNL